MKSSCISHPESEPLILIRKWQVEFCEGNFCAASLMSFFEYWHSIKLEIAKQAAAANKVAEVHGDLASQYTGMMQWHTTEDLKEGILGSYSLDKIRASLALLEKKKVILVSRNPNPRYAFDKTKYFVFNPDIANQFLRDRASRSAENQAAYTDNLDPYTKNRAQYQENRGAITETTTETTTKTSSETTKDPSASSEASYIYSSSTLTSLTTVDPPSLNVATAYTPSNNNTFSFKESLLEQGATSQSVDDWLAVRKKKKAANTRTALDGFLREASKAGITVAEAVVMCAERGWQSLRAEWITSPANGNGSQPPLRNLRIYGDGSFDDVGKGRTIDGECF